MLTNRTNIGSTPVVVIETTVWQSSAKFYGVAAVVGRAHCLNSSPINFIDGRQLPGQAVRLEGMPLSDNRQYQV